MNRAAVEAHCPARPGVTGTYPFGPEPLVFKVVGKMFALVSTHDDGKEVVSLKCDPDRASLLRGGFLAITPGYHLNKDHWNTLVLDGTSPEALVLDLIDHSYALVAVKLSKKERAKLNLTREDLINASTTKWSLSLRATPNAWTERVPALNLGESL